MTGRLPTKQEVLATAGAALARGIARTLSMDPHEAALAAKVNGGPSVEVLEARIREMHDLVNAAKAA
ncbi:hypothetical protein ACXR2T_10800 [Leucobacter sp. HY1910]